MHDAQLHVDHALGSSPVVLSNHAWKHYTLVLPRSLRRSHAHCSLARLSGSYTSLGSQRYLRVKHLGFTLVSGFYTVTFAHGPLSLVEIAPLRLSGSRLIRSASEYFSGLSLSHRQDASCSITPRCVSLLLPPAFLSTHEAIEEYIALLGMTMAEAAITGSVTLESIVISTSYERQASLCFHKRWKSNRMNLT